MSSSTMTTTTTTTNTSSSSKAVVNAPPTPPHSQSHSQSKPSPPSSSSSSSTNSALQDDKSTICQNCQTTNTPLWRRDESGQVLCNACGLFLKLHGRARPIHLKTDTIKSRNRLKTSNVDDDRNGIKKKKKKKEIVPQHQQLQQFTSGTVNSPHPQPQYQLQHPQNQPPQDSQRVAAPLLDQLSTAAVSVSKTAPTTPITNESSVQSLKTRVAELELVNDLFKTRMAQLEKDNEQLAQTLEKYKTMIKPNDHNELSVSIKSSSV